MKPAIALTVVGTLLTSVGFIWPWFNKREPWQPPIDERKIVIDVRKVNFRYCDDSAVQQSFKVTSLTLDGQIASGNSINVTVEGTANQSASVALSSFYLLNNNIRLFEDNQSFKKDFAAGAALKFKHSCDLPYFIPQGKYVSVYSLQNAIGQVLCVQFDVDISLDPSSSLTESSPSAEPVAGSSSGR